MVNLHHQPMISCGGIYLSIYSILLADKYAVSSEKGLEYVANEILRVVNKEEIYLTSNVINTLQNAINYYRSREGSYSSMDPLISISETFIKEKTRVKLSIFEKEELSLLLEVIDENIDFLNKYDYSGLSLKSAIEYKQQKLVPLFGIRDNVLKEVESRNSRIV